jgi:hypothetical protein
MYRRLGPTTARMYGKMRGAVAAELVRHLNMSAPAMSVMK